MKRRNLCNFIFSFYSVFTSIHAHLTLSGIIYQDRQKLGSAIL